MKGDATELLIAEFRAFCFYHYVEGVSLVVQIQNLRDFRPFINILITAVPAETQAYCLWPLVD